MAKKSSRKNVPISKVDVHPQDPPQLLITIAVVDSHREHYEPHGLWLSQFSFNEADYSQDETITEPVVQAVRGAVRTALLLGVDQIVVQGIKP
jgi:hypothetical protein